MDKTTHKPILTVGAWLFVGVAVIIASWPVIEMITGHAFNPSWPNHARFHVFWSAGQLVSLALVSASVGLFPFRLGAKWAWCVETIIVVLGYSTSILAYAFFDRSAPLVPPLVLLVVRVWYWC